ERRSRAEREPRVRDAAYEAARIGTAARERGRSQQQRCENQDSLHAPSVEARDERTMTAPFMRRSSARRQTSTVRVLVVEDEPRMASVIRRSLEREGLAADVAGRGED